MGQTSHPQADAYCEQGQKLLEQRKYLSALEYFQAAVELDAEHVEALYGQVCVYRALGKLDKERELQRQMDVVIQKKPSGEHRDLSSKGQLEKARKRYSALLKKLVTIQTDDLGLSHGVYTPEASAELSECEDFIETLERQLNLNRTDFKRKRKEALSNVSSTPRMVRKACRKAKRMYTRLIRHNLVRTSSTQRIFEVSPSIQEREKTLRSKIVALDAADGKSWCSQETARLLKRRVDLPRRIIKVLKIIGIVLAVGVGLVVVYFILRYLMYIIIGGFVLWALAKFFFGD